MTKEKIFEIIIETGKKIIPDFQIFTEQEKYYEDLFRYFKNEQSILNTKKGLLLFGNYGCGKSLSIKLFKRLFPFSGIISSRHIIREFAIKGEKIIDYYGRNCFVEGKIIGTFLKDKPKTYCFDDLGINDAMKNRYGNTINVMAEIIFDRYDNYCDYGMKSFFTTNKTTDEIERLYGDRVRDRLKEMCNPIIMPEDSLRK